MIVSHDYPPKPLMDFSNHLFRDFYINTHLYPLLHEFATHTFNIANLFLSMIKSLLEPLIRHQRNPSIILIDLNDD